MDKVNGIKDYISIHKDDDDGDWEYCHTPVLESMLRQLNETEVKAFSNGIWDWNEYHLYKIADTVIFCGNKFLDDVYLYLKIISQINNLEYLDYLVENIVRYIPDLPKEIVQKWEASMLENLRIKIEIVKGIKDDSWKSKLQKSADYLAEELNQRKT